MNEAETRAELIDPALQAAGWGVVSGSRVRREFITLGRLQSGNTRSKQDIADYVLEFHNQKLAVIEAKRRSAPVTEGLAQAKRYAEKLQTRFTYSTNGVGIYQVDLDSGTEGEVDHYPTPDELWEATFGESQAQESYWRSRFSKIPFEERGGQWQPRFYQHNAITNALDAIAQGRDRLLLTLATGTGKTAIAFQIAWKLFHSRWNLTDWRAGLGEGEEPQRRPRILFLADRNILADQAFNAFGAFSEDALVRIDPQVIRTRGRVPKNGSVFFTIFQTFMTGVDEEGNPKPNFGDYPPDFFDLIVVDECHRGGANDESTWRGILEYFSPAVQLGLTATPRRDINADTYNYFGDPVYVYSLREGINDGFLSPFKVRQFATTLDEYEYEADDNVLVGEVEEGKTYTEEDFNRVIEIPERERKRVALFMEEINQQDKTLVFCANQEHALTIRDCINQSRASTDPNYCVRVTADEGQEGERWLRIFQDNEKTIPTILTTSHKLSTGVDARNVRNIVLLRPIRSIIEFKQIIGRGTRLYEGKDHFTVYDFVKAYEHFNDPEWDGEPEDPLSCSTCGQRPCVCPRKICEACGQSPCECPPQLCQECQQFPCVCQKPPRLKITLADGKEMLIRHITSTIFMDGEGNMITAQEFIERLYGELPKLFEDEDKLRELWSNPTTRQALLQNLEEAGFGMAQLSELRTMIDAEQSDLFDVLAYIRFQVEPLSRQQRVENCRDSLLTQYPDEELQAFLDFVLRQYVSEGVNVLNQEQLPHLLELRYHTVTDAKVQLGSLATIREAFTGFQRHLYDSLQG